MGGIHTQLHNIFNRHNATATSAATANYQQFNAHRIYNQPHVQMQIHNSHNPVYHTVQNCLQYLSSLGVPYSLLPDNTRTLLEKVLGCADVMQKMPADEVASIVCS